jgi:hypothetical protein
VNAPGNPDAKKAVAFLKKAPQKILITFIRDVAALPGSKKFFAELFFKKATSAFPNPVA